MFLSAIIHLTALEKGSMPQHMATALRAEFLKWISEFEPSQAEELHAGSALRPYTVSELHATFRSKDGYDQVKSGQSAWFRITCLRAKESSLLLNKILPSLTGRKISLQGINFQVGSAAVGGHPWARVESAQVLFEKYFNRQAHLPDFFDMEFTSPTMFADGNLHLPLPIPENVFNSWLRHWNDFAEHALPREVGTMQEANIVINQFEHLHTQPVKLAFDSPVGFMGTCRFRTLADDDFWLRLCNLLADFSFYCGTGKNSAIGFGQTKRL